MKPVRFVKIFYSLSEEDPGDMINAWVAETGSLIESVSITGLNGLLTAVVLYHKQDTVDEEPGPILINPEGAAIPFVATVMLDGTEKKKAYCMAGIFGVPEGWTMGPEDVDAAPNPVFSPDFKLCDLPAGWFVLREEIPCQSV